MIKICAMSDLHGYLPDPTKIEKCDLVLLCGDLVSLEDQGNYYRGAEWYQFEFLPWVEELPCEKVLFIFGNHELCCMNHERKYLELFPQTAKATLLLDSEYDFEKDGKTYRIYGTPWCKIFGHWAYMASPEMLIKFYSNIPENLDILMTHDQPFGYYDICQQDVSWNKHEHIGNPQLAEAVIEKQPRYLLCGHLHTTERFGTINSTLRYNVSIKDEQYKPVFSPTYIEIE